MGRGQNKRDPFAEVFGSRRGDLSLQPLLASTLTPEAERAIKKLLQRAHKGAFAEVLARVCALSNTLTTKPPALEVLYERLGEELLPPKWQQASEKWCQQFTTPHCAMPLFAEDNHLLERLHRDNTNIIRTFALHEEPPQTTGEGSTWQTRIEDWRRERGRTALRLEHLEEAKEYLDTHPENARKIFNTLLGLGPKDPAEKLYVQNDIEMPLRPLTKEEWGVALDLLTYTDPTNPPLPQARSSDIDKARQEIIKILLAEAPSPGPVPAFSADHPGIAVGDFVRERMDALNKTDTELAKASGVSFTSVRRLMRRSTEKHGARGGGRIRSLKTTEQFCGCLGLNAHVVYLCGLVAELPGAKRTKSGNLWGGRHTDAVKSLDKLKAQGAPKSALQAISLYVDGTLEARADDHTFWVPFHDLLFWEQKRLT